MLSFLFPTSVPVVVFVVAGVSAIRKLVVTGGSPRRALGRQIETLMQTRVGQSVGTIDFRLLLIDNPRFPQAIRQSGFGSISYTPLPRPIVERLPALLRQAVAQATQFPTEKRKIGEVRHRERSVFGKAAVTVTGHPSRPIRLKFRPWRVGVRLVGAYKLEAHQASALADLMDHGAEQTAVVQPHPGDVR